MRDLDPERFGIQYLQEEIRWHRQAGRTIFYFVIGLAASLVVSLAAHTYRGPVDLLGLLAQLLPIGVLLGLIIAGGFFFYKYFREISFLKSAVQTLMLHRMTDEWSQSQFSLLSGRPRAPKERDSLVFGLAPELVFDKLAIALDRDPLSLKRKTTIARRLLAIAPGELWIEVTVLRDPKGSQVFVAMGSFHRLTSSKRVNSTFREVLARIKTEVR